MTGARGAGACVAGLLALSGCARMEPGLGFDGVRESVSERAGMRVHWNNGSEEDAAAAGAVDEMLGREVTAAEAVQVALLNNRELQATYEELSIAQADIVQAGLLRNPVFSGEVRFATDGSGATVVLDVAQEFLSLLYAPMRKGLAEAAFEAAKLRVTGAVLDLAGDVEAAYYEYVASEQVLEMRRTVVEGTGASYELAVRLRNAGNITALDQSHERALHESARQALAGAEGEVVQARERLNALMGVWGPQTGWRSAARLPALPEVDDTGDGLERRALEASLDLALARREVEVAARAARLARPLGWLAEAEVGIAAERESGGDWSLGPSLSLPIPLLDQGQAASGAAGARLRQAQERYFARGVEIRARVRAAWSAVANARERIAHFERVILPLRQEIVDQTQLQYNAMQVSGFELLQARRDQIESGGEYIAALRDYWVARSRLDLILNGRMTPFERTRIAGSALAGGAIEGGH
jgi:cobalt-zinc-cadmium efflux system outer membrane protein